MRTTKKVNLYVTDEFVSSLKYIANFYEVTQVNAFFIVDNYINDCIDLNVFYKDLTKDKKTRRTYSIDKVLIHDVLNKPALFQAATIQLAANIREVKSYALTLNVRFYN